MPTNKPTLGSLPAPAWHRPWFRYVDTVDGAGGTPKGDDLGFPKDTPVESMTADEKAAYWHNQTKVQQKAREAAEKASQGYAKFGTVEDLQKAADDAEAARVAALDDNQKAVEAARAAGKAEAAAEHANKHLGSAVTGMLIALTKSATESFDDATARVAGAIEFADLNKFIGDNGDLDAAKVQTFAKSIGSTDSGGTGQGSFPLYESMQRQSLPAPGSSGSVDQYEQKTYDRLTSKK